MAELLTSALAAAADDPNKKKKKKDHDRKLSKSKEAELAEVADDVIQTEAQDAENADGKGGKKSKKFKRRNDRDSQLNRKIFKFKPRKFTTCIEKLVMFLTVIPYAGMCITLITGLDAFHFEESEYFWVLQYVVSFENFLIVCYVYNVVLNPMYFHKFHLLLYNHNFYLQRKIVKEHEKKTCKFCCKNLKNCINRCCCICCANLFKLVFLGSAFLLVFVIFFINYSALIPYDNATEIAAIVYGNIAGYTIIITAMNVWISAHLFLNQKGLFTSIYIMSWGGLTVVFNIFDFDFENLEFTGTFDNLIAIGSVCLTIFVLIIVVSSIMRARTVAWLKRFKKKLNKVGKDKKEKKKAKKKAKKKQLEEANKEQAKNKQKDKEKEKETSDNFKGKRSDGPKDTDKDKSKDKDKDKDKESDKSPAPKDITLELGAMDKEQKSVVHPETAVSLLTEIPGKKDNDEDDKDKDKGKDLDDIDNESSVRHERARSLSSASSAGTIEDADIDALLSEDDDDHVEDLYDPAQGAGGNVARAKNILFAKMKGLANDLDNLDDEYGVEGVSPRSEQGEAPDGIDIAGSGKKFNFNEDKEVDLLAAVSGNLNSQRRSNRADSLPSTSKGGLHSGPVSPSSRGVATPLVIAFGVGKEEKKQEIVVKEHVSRKKARKVHCCCRLFECKLVTCYKGINFINSMAFWMLWGTLFAVGFQRGLLLPVCFFAIVVVTYNPLYYAGALKYNMEDMVDSDKVIKERVELAKTESEKAPDEEAASSPGTDIEAKRTQSTEPGTEPGPGTATGDAKNVDPTDASGKTDDGSGKKKKEKKKKYPKNARRFCGFCGCCDCCFECCTHQCVPLRKCFSCTPLVCFYRIMFGVGVFLTFLLCLSTFSVFVDSISERTNTDIDIYNLVNYTLQLFGYENEELVNSLDFEKNGTLASIIGFVIILPIYYVPGVGYLFYHSPVSFGFFNIINSFLFFVAPVFIYAQFVNNGNVWIIEAFDGTFFESETDDTTAATTFTTTTTLEPEEDGVLSFFSGINDDFPLVELVLVSVLVLVIFLSLAGFSCAYYRFRRALVMTQFKIFNVLKNQFVFGNESEERDLTWIRMFSLLFAFLDFVSDVMFVTLTQQDEWANDFIQYTAVALLVLQIVVQLVSVYGAISSLRSKFGKKKERIAYAHNISKGYDERCKCKCFLWDFLIKWVLVILYSLFLISISVMLGLTKLIAIKQIQSWWLRWIITDYDEAVQKTTTLEEHEEVQNTMRLGNVPSLSQGGTSKNRSNKRKRRDSTSIAESDKESDNESDREDSANVSNEFLSADHNKKAKKKSNADDSDDDDDDDDEDEDEDGGCIVCMRSVLRWIEDRTPKAIRKYKIEANVYNAYFVSELIVESLPQLVLNFINAHYNKSWTQFSIISTVFSAVMIGVSMLKFVYFVGFKNLEMRQFML